MIYDYLTNFYNAMATIDFAGKCHITNVIYFIIGTIKTKFPHLVIIVVLLYVIIIFKVYIVYILII